MAIGATVGMKVISMAIGIPVGIATRKAIARAWTVARPDNPPKKPHDPDARWGDAIGWAALSGAGVVVAQLVTQSSTRSVYRVDHRQRAAAAADEGPEEAAEGGQEGCEEGGQGTGEGRRLTRPYRSRGSEAG